EVLVALELLHPLLVLAGVIARDAALPVAGAALGAQREELVEVGKRGVDAAELEAQAAARVIGVGFPGIELQKAAVILLARGIGVEERLPGELVGPRVVERAAQIERRLV